MSDNQRLIDLEIRLAYLEDTLNTLDGVITRQAEDMTKLEKANKLLLGKLEGLAEQFSALGARPQDESPPPHY